MAVFHCARFPDGEVPIRTRLGLVVFTDGRAEVEDPELCQALREVPSSFGITEEDAAGAGNHGAAPAAPPPKPKPRSRRTAKSGES